MIYRLLLLFFLLVNVQVAAQDDINVSVMACTGLTQENWFASIEVPVATQYVVSREIVQTTDFENAVLMLEGITIWEGYPADGQAYTMDEVADIYGFDWPFMRTFQVAKFTFYTTEGDRYLWLYYSAFTPDLFYAMPFDSMEPHDDGQGNWFGLHPCGIYAVDYDDVALLMKASGLTQ